MDNESMITKLGTMSKNSIVATRDLYIVYHLVYRHEHDCWGDVSIRGISTRLSGKLTLPVGITSEVYIASKSIQL